MLRWIFPFGMFLSAILLFSIQPMVAKTLLPVFGGTPAVWTVCMLFFQLVLLIAYAYVWLISCSNKRLVWRGVHLVLVLFSLLFLPLHFRPLLTQGLPEWVILSNLFGQLGLPLLIIGASAPLLQFAYSQTGGKGSSDPYFLYVASNLGSLAALLLYPFLIERYSGLLQQFLFWNWGYIAYVLLLVGLLVITPFQDLPQKTQEKVNLPWCDMAMWVFLSFVPCSLMLGVTLYISTDVAATPLFWVVPLALYLLTFVFAFSLRPVISHEWIARNTLFFLIFTVTGFILGVTEVKAWQMILVNLLSFFMLAFLCHRELFLNRPQASQLTLFYFCVALGGVGAGVFNGLIAPHVFNQVYEYPLAILLATLVLPAKKITGNLWVPLIVLCCMLVQYFLPDLLVFKIISIRNIFMLLALIILVLLPKSKMSFTASFAVLLVFIFSPYLQKNKVLLQERSFYAVNQVKAQDDVHVFISQSTVHGLQWMSEKKPLNGFRAYYGAIEPVVNLMQQEKSAIAVTLMGLGTGTMLCQFRATDRVTVVEIDQQVIDIAKNPTLFTYFRDCPPQVDLIKNDGRLAVANLPDSSQNLLVLDAFNSDAIPVHLMTLEAFRLYQKKITPDGVILINLSNRHLNLLPLVNAMGRSLEMITLHLFHVGNRKLGQFDSEWALLTANQAVAMKVMNTKGWRFVADEKQILWTDDYSNLIPLLRWQ